MQRRAVGSCHPSQAKQGKTLRCYHLAIIYKLNNMLPNKTRRQQLLPKDSLEKNKSVISSFLLSTDGIKLNLRQVCQAVYLVCLRTVTIWHN